MLSTVLENLRSEDVRSVYLVTYSRADLVKFPTRKSFGDAVSKAFRDAPGKVVPVYWAVCQEAHEDGAAHYHASILLTKPRRWNPIKEILTKTYGIVVNFKENDRGYDSAYEYISKSDGDLFCSENHPNIVQVGTPSTKAAMNSYAERRRKRKSDEQLGAEAEGGDPSENPTSSTKANKKTCRRLTILEVCKFIVKKNITKRVELLCEAK
eukprot:TCONS_00014537-protein